MLVIKCPMNSKTACLLCDPCYFPGALDAQFLAAFVRRRYQHLDSNICSNRRASAAEDQRSIKCNVVREAALRVLCPIAPMEYDGQLELVSNSRSALQNRFSHQQKSRTCAESTAYASTPQVTIRLENQRSEVGDVWAYRRCGCVQNVLRQL